MGLQDKGQKGDYEKPSIPDNYYIAKLLPPETPDDVDLEKPRFDFAMPTYDRDECLGMVMLFELIDGEHEGTQLAFFAPEKLSLKREDVKEKPSRLAANLGELGVLGHVAESLGVKDQIADGRKKWMAEKQSEHEQLAMAIRDAIGGKKVRVHVEKNDDGDSQISALSKIFDEDEEVDGA